MSANNYIETFFTSRIVYYLENQQLTFQDKETDHKKKVDNEEMFLQEWVFANLIM